MAEDDRGLLLPEGATREMAEELAANLSQIMPPSIAGDRNRLLAVRHITWQTLAAMMNKGWDQDVAVQTVVVAVMDVLESGLGSSGAAAHLRLMADSLEAALPH